MGEIHSQNKIIVASKLPSHMEGYKMEYQQMEMIKEI